VFGLLLNVGLEAVVLPKKRSIYYLKRRSGIYVGDNRVLVTRVHRLLGYNLYLKSISCFYANYMDYEQINSISFKNMRRDDVVWVRCTVSVTSERSRYS
jgi:hypothetical protein